MFSFKQNIMMNNNNDLKKFNNNIELIVNVLENGDTDLIKKINILTLSENDSRLNLLFKLIKSNIIIENKFIKIKKFFNLISPLNLEFNLGSIKWDYKIKNNSLYIHNFLLEEHSTNIIYDKYINNIKNILLQSNIKFEFNEFDNKQIDKTLDIVFRIEKN